MLRVTLGNPAQKRTLMAKYAQTQATAYSGFLDPDWARTYDIYPGSVMARGADQQFTLFTGAEGQQPFGLSALFVAPQMGIDEVLATGGNEFTVWTIEPQGEFEVLAPAFDQEADWAAAATSHGGVCLLTGTTSSATLSSGWVQPPGVLTPTGADNSNSIAELISVESTTKILIRGRRFSFASSVTVGTGS